MIDIYLGLFMALLTFFRRLFYKGSNLCIVSLVNFILVFLIYYVVVYYPYLKDSVDFNVYVIGMIRGALITSLIVIFSRRDHENHGLWGYFLLLTILTMQLDFFRYLDVISDNLYINLGRLSTIIELLLINMNFTYVKGSGFLKNISGGHAFFTNNWSFKTTFTSVTNIFSNNCSARSRGLLLGKRLSTIAACRKSKQGF